MRLNVGDKVRCIDARTFFANGRSLYKGDVYTVVEARRDPDDGLEYVKLAEADDGMVSWSAKRFEKLEVDGVE